MAFQSAGFQSPGFQMGAVPAVFAGAVVVANTVARLGSLFLKTAYGVRPINGLSEAPLAVKRFLDDLKTERRRVLAEERKKLSTLKTEKRKIEVRLTEKPSEPERWKPEYDEESLKTRIAELEAKVYEQSAVVREQRRQVEEAEQARIDAIAEHALQEWMREEEERKVAETKRIADEEDEMMQVLLLIHESE